MIDKLHNGRYAALYGRAEYASLDRLDMVVLEASAVEIRHKLLLASGLYVFCTC